MTGRRNWCTQLSENCIRLRSNFIQILQCNSACCLGLGNLQTWELVFVISVVSHSLIQQKCSCWSVQVCCTKVHILHDKCALLVFNVTVTTKMQFTYLNLAATASDKYC